MRVSEAMNEAGINVKGKPVEEAMFQATCQGCGAKHKLDTITPQDSGQQSEYACTECGEVFVIVGPAPGLAGGYRLGENVVNPLGGMEIQVPGAA